MHGLVLHNGEIRAAGDALLLPGQVGYLNGWGVFSTLRVTDGVLFAFERHYARMKRDAGLLRVPFEYSADELQRALQALVEANGAFDAVLRVAVVRNRGGLFEAPSLKRDSDLVAFTAPLTKWAAGAHLTYVPDARYGASPFSGVKTTSWAQNLTIYEKVQTAGYDEAILLNEHGQVSECTSANIFAVQEQTVVTPPLATAGCLPGVTRAILLEEIAAPGIQIIEKELIPSELEASDAVFITSTTRDLIPVFSIDGMTIRRQQRVLELLQNEFAAFRKAYAAQNASGSYVVHS